MSVIDLLQWIRLFVHSCSLRSGFFRLFNFNVSGLVDALLSDYNEAKWSVLLNRLENLTKCKG